MYNQFINCGNDAPSAITTQTKTERIMNYVSDVAAKIEAEFKKERNGFCKITLADLLAMDIEETPMIFGEYIHQKGLMAIVGTSDTGKSLLARQLGLSITAKQDFLGWSNKCKHNRIAYISTEDDENATAHLVKKANKILNINNEDCSNMYFEFFPLEIPRLLNDFLQETPVDVVIIDVFEDLFNGSDPNNASNIRHILYDYKNIAEKHNCLIVFVHHTNKYTESLAPSKDNASGSHAFTAALRLVMELKKDPTETDKFHICIVKGNYISDKEKRSSFVLRRDEHLVYHNTGERVPFEEIVANGEGEKGEIKARKTPENFGNELHLLIIKGHFSTGEFSKSDVNDCVKKMFMVSDQPSRKFTNYYIERKWLIPTSKEKQPKYKMNPALLQ